MIVIGIYFGHKHGLKGEEIPQLSRILAIVDSYDAMTNDRSYKKAISREAAMEELVRCSGTQFDPNFVPIFIEVMES